MDRIEFKVDGMHCDGCAQSVQRMLSSLPGVASVEVSFAAGKANVAFDPSRAGLADFKRAVERAGFKAA